MAQSRINKAASIFTRLNGLVKSGLIPWNERPVWYDIYKTFPPDRDPLYRSVLGHDEIAPLPRKLFYYEDDLRAYYFDNFIQTEPISLNSNLTKPISDIFIQVYVELAKKGISNENLIEASIEEMKNRGYPIKKRGVKNQIESNDAETDNEDPSNVILDLLNNLNINKNEVIETKPDEHDKNTSTSINSNSQNNINNSASNDKNQK